MQVAAYYGGQGVRTRRLQALGVTGADVTCQLSLVSAAQAAAAEDGLRSAVNSNGLQASKT